MNYSVYGVSRSLPEWAATLGVTEQSLQLDMRRGETLLEIVRRMQVDTFTSRGHPVRQQGELSTFASGLKTPGSSQAECAIYAGCRQCLSAARDDYDAMHTAHMAAEEAAEVSRR